MNHKLPHTGVPVSPEYIEMVREYFPRLPRAAITQYWKYNASISEIRTDLERFKGEQALPTMLVRLTHTEKWLPLLQG